MTGLWSGTKGLAVGCARHMTASVLKEEAQHFPCGIRTSRIGVGASGTAARPGVSGAVDFPMLKDSASARVGMDRTRIGMSPGCAPTMHVLLQVRSPLPGNDVIAVARMYRVVAVPMKNNGRHNRPLP